MSITAFTDVSGCNLLLIRSAGVTTDTSGRLTAWADQSGAGNHVIVPADANKPQVLADCIAFGNSGTANHFLTLPASYAINSQSCSVFAIYRPYAAADTVDPIWNSSAAASNKIALGFFTGQILVSSSSVNTLQASAYNARMDLRGFVSSATALKILDGMTETGYAAVAANSSTGGAIGRWSADNSNTLRGDLVAIISYNKAVSAQELADIKDLLARKFGVCAATDQIVFDGDSITVGTGSNHNQGFVRDLDAMLPKSVRFINRAVSGQAWAAITAPAVQPVLSGGKNLTIAFAGTNDLASAHTPATAWTDAQAYLAKVQAAYDRVLMLTMIPRTGITEQNRTDYNALLVSGASTYGYGLVRLDLDPSIGLAGQNLDTSMINGGIHPTSDGHAVIARIMARYAAMALYGPKQIEVLSPVAGSAFGSGLGLLSVDAVITASGAFRRR